MGKGPGSTMVLGEAFEGSWATGAIITKSSKGCIANTSWAEPAAIGSTTPAAGTFNALTVSDGYLMHLGGQTDPDPAGSNGDMYYNTTNDKFRVYQNGGWLNMIGTSVPAGADGELLTNDGASGIDSEANATFDGTDFSIASGGAYQFGGSDVISNPGGNLLLGIGAGASRTSFILNYFAGPDAGFSCTSGNQNIAVGQDAMYSALNAGLCAAMGYQALRANVSSALNTAIGFQAGLNYTQARGTFIGGEAGKLSTNGANMLCLGGEAAESNIGGNSITAIGSRSMTNKGASNSFNTCIGVESGRDNTSNDGVFIGYWAGRLALGGSFQTVGVGTSAMQQLDSGNQNTGVGHLIFNSLTTGSRNIGIGWFADVSTNSINSSIVIGYNAHLTASNQCVIGSEVNNGRIYDFYWGCGVSRVSPSDVTHHGSGASGTDNAAADYIWEVGLSTGGADPAEFLWRTTDIGTPATTTPQTASTTMRLNEDGLTVERALQVNGGATSTVADTVNVVGMTVTQNDVTNNPTALAVTNTGTGHGAHVQSADTDSIVWQALFENPRNNASVTNYGSGIRMGLSTFASGGNEDDKWVGIANVQETTFGNTSGMAFYTNQDAGGGSAPTEKMRLSGAGYLGVRVTAPSTPLHVDQDDASAAVPVATLDQGDADESFVNYIGTSAADASASISTEPAGDTSASTVAAPHSASWTLAGMIKCEVNGSDAWIPYYTPV